MQQQQQQDIILEEEKQYLDHKILLVYNYDGAYTSSDDVSIGSFNNLTFRAFLDYYKKQPKYRFKWHVCSNYVIVCWMTYYRSRDPFKKGSVFDIFDDMTGNTGYVSEGHSRLSFLAEV